MIRRFSVIEFLSMSARDPSEAEPFVYAKDYDALKAEWMALYQYDGKVERALESAQARIRDLEAALRAVRPAYLEYCDNADIIDKALANSSQSDAGVEPK